MLFIQCKYCLKCPASYNIFIVAFLPAPQTSSPFLFTEHQSSLFSYLQLHNHCGMRCAALIFIFQELCCYKALQLFFILRKYLIFPLFTSILTHNWDVEELDVDESSQIEKNPSNVASNMEYYFGHLFSLLAWL